MREPFQTQNRRLAHALLLAGCQLAPKSDGGPVANFYTPDKLRDMKLLPASPVPTEELEAAAMRAFRRSLPGIVTYFFVRNATFEKAEAAWQEMVIELQKASSEDRAPKLPEISEEVIAQVMCIYANSVETMMAIPFSVAPWISTISAQTSTHENTRVIKGAGKAWPLNASPEARKNIKIS